MAKRNRCVASLQKTIRNKEFSWGSKMKIHKSVIRPTTLYGSETWTLTKREEMKIRTSMGKNSKENFWREEDRRGVEEKRRSNTEIYELFNDPTIYEVVRSNRLQRPGHMERSVKEIEGTEDKKKPGRPGKGWRETVWEDIRRRNITNWKEYAKDKKIWKEEANP